MNRASNFLLILFVNFFFGPVKMTLRLVHASYVTVQLIWRASCRDVPKTQTPAQIALENKYMG